MVELAHTNPARTPNQRDTSYCTWKSFCFVFWPITLIVAEMSAEEEFHLALDLLPVVLEPRLAVRLLKPRKISVNGVFICAWLYWNWPLKSSHLSEDEVRLNCSVGIKVLMCWSR